MKRCSYCGAEYPDELNECPVDHATVVPSASAAHEKNKDNHEQPMPKWKRITLRVIGGVLLLLTIWAYLKGLDAVSSGDYGIAVQASSRSQYTQHITNVWYRIAFILFVAGVACIGNIIPLKIWKGNRKHGRSSA